MVYDFILNLASGLFVIGFILYLLHYGWFRKYTTILLNLTYVSISTPAGIIAGILRSLPKIVTALLKAIIALLMFFLLTGIYLITIVVPLVGGRTNKLYKLFGNRLEESSLVVRAGEMRGMMIEIVAEHNDRELNFNSEKEYQEELDNIKKKSKNRLETGETILSLSLGFVLLVAQLLQVELFQFHIFGFPTPILIEMYLLLIAISIIYRVSILDFLAYSSEAQFETLEEADVALAYQKAVSLVSFIQGLIVFLYFAYAISRVRYTTLKWILKRKHGENLGIRSWLPMAWRRLRSEHLEEDEKE